MYVWVPLYVPRPFPGRLWRPHSVGRGHDWDGIKQTLLDARPLRDPRGQLARVCQHVAGRVTLVVHCRQAGVGLKLTDRCRLAKAVGQRALVAFPQELLALLGLAGTSGKDWQECPYKTCL